MFDISNYLSPQDYKKVEAFLAKIRPLLKTNDVTIEPTSKNKQFEREFNMRDAEKIKVLETLTADDCTKIEPNNNPRYPNSEVFFFLKNIKVVVYGEIENPLVYIKMYVAELSMNDCVIVISFHKEGMHDI